jgi:CMP-N,N'-diacetyllegionaminic acid synthase
MRTLFLLVARLGSKGVPRKNLREIGGISLIGYKAIAAKKSKYCSRLVISTESSEIQDEARRYGVEVPFTRPAELASDTASSMDVILHAMNWFQEHTEERFDALMLLEPSSPLARPEDYDGAVEMMMDRQANVVVGVRPVEPNSVFVGPLDDRGRITSIIDKMSSLTGLRRQDLPEEYTMNAALYLMRWDYMLKARHVYKDRENSYGYPMPPEYSIEIDTPMDLRMVEFMIEKGYVDLSPWKNER